MEPSIVLHRHDIFVQIDWVDFDDDDDDDDVVVVVVVVFVSVECVCEHCDVVWSCECEWFKSLCKCLCVCVRFWHFEDGVNCLHSSYQ